MSTRLKEFAVILLLLVGFGLLAVGTITLRAYMVAYRAEQVLTVEAADEPPTEATR